MKKLILSIATALMAFAGAHAQDAPAARWGSILDGTTSAGDQCSAVAVGGDGTAYYLTTMGTTESAPDIMLNGEVIAQGALYNAGNSQNNNLCLLALNPDGTKKWVVYSNAGDFSSGEGNVAVDSQGNIVFTALVRHTDGMLDLPINLIDAQGVKTEFGGTVERRSYSLLIAKLSADGSLLWHKFISPSTEFSGSSDGFISSAVKSSALAVDAADNVYVGGNYRNNMQVAEGVVLPARNVDNFTGDSQESAGNMFLLKYDTAGNYVDSRIGSDGVTETSLSTLLFAGDALYYVASAKGTGTVEFCNADVTLGGDLTVVIGKIALDFETVWTNVLAGEINKKQLAMQNVALTACGDNLWFAGMFNGKFTDAEGNSFADGATLREGCLVKFNASTGRWINAAVSYDGDFTPAVAKTGLTGYLKAIQSAQNPNKVYVYGYVMNATVGVVLRQYDAETLLPDVDNCWSLATGGGVPSATAIAYDESSNSAFIAARGNRAFTLLAPEPFSPAYTQTTWAILCANFSMPTTLSDVNAIENIAVGSDSSLPKEYYNLQGVRVESPAPGNIYICRQGSNITKVLIK